MVVLKTDVANDNIMVIMVLNVRRREYTSFDQYVNVLFVLFLYASVRTQVLTLSAS